MFPLHLLDEDGDALCGNLAEKQERFIEMDGLESLPTVAEKRDDESWFYFVGDLCGNCRTSLMSEIDDEALHEGWKDRQEAIRNV